VKIDLALREAHDAEVALGAELRRVGRAHRAEHDVFHLTRTLGAWCERNRRRLAEQAERHGVDLAAGTATGAQGAGRAAGSPEEPGMRLLWDLRDVHLAAARASVAWTVLGQGAQAVGDGELLAVVTASHPETLRTMRWAVQKLKDASPQVLAS
jgi:hypothetical protein